SVMPSWLVDRYAGSRPRIEARIWARRPPSLTSSRTRVGRTLTMANSEATKKAFASTSSMVRPSARLLGMIGPSVLEAAPALKTGGGARGRPFRTSVSDVVQAVKRHGQRGQPGVPAGDAEREVRLARRPAVA